MMMIMTYLVLVIEIDTIAITFSNHSYCFLFLLQVKGGGGDDGGGGQCIWYDHCGSNKQGNLSCAYNSAPRRLTGDGLTALKNTCPELVEEYSKYSCSSSSSSSKTGNKTVRNRH